MRGLIFGGGKTDISFVAEFLKGKDYDCIIAADGGLEALIQISLKPDLVVGDMDSVGAEVLKHFQEMDDIQWKIHKAEKDETDLELALLEGIACGCTHMDILGGTGGRMDHMLTNIQLIYQMKIRQVDCTLYDKQNQISILTPTDDFLITSEMVGDSYISFIPFTSKVTGLTLEGFQYPLKKKNLELGSGLCVSNRLQGEVGHLSFEEGVLVFILSSD